MPGTRRARVQPWPTTPASGVTDKSQGLELSTLDEAAAVAAGGPTQVGTRPQASTRSIRVITMTVVATVVAAVTAAAEEEEDVEVDDVEEDVVGEATALRRAAAHEKACRSFQDVSFSLFRFFLFLDTTGASGDDYTLRWTEA
jgi:hypothetical protein